MNSFPENALEKHLKDPENWWCQLVLEPWIDARDQLRKWHRNYKDLVVSQALLFCFRAGASLPANERGKRHSSFWVETQTNRHCFSIIRTRGIKKPSTPMNTQIARKWMFILPSMRNHHSIWSIPNIKFIPVQWHVPIQQPSRSLVTWVFPAMLH